MTEIKTTVNYQRLINLIQSNRNYHLQIDGENSLDNFKSTYFIVVNRFNSSWTVPPVLYYYDGHKYKSVFFFDEPIKKCEFESAYYNLMDRLGLKIGVDVLYANQAITETHKGADQVQSIKLYGPVLKKSEYCGSVEELW